MMSTQAVTYDLHDKGGPTVQEDQYRDKIISPELGLTSGSTVQIPGSATYSINKSTGSFYVKIRPEKRHSRIVKSVQMDIDAIADIDDEGYVRGLELLLTDKEVIEKIRINSLDK